MEKKKVLVVYFSATGTTEKVAQRLARVAEADICEITPAQPYSSADLDWTNPKSRSSVEMNDPKSRPAVNPVDVDIRQHEGSMTASSSAIPFGGTLPRESSTRSSKATT